MDGMFDDSMCHGGCGGLETVLIFDCANGGLIKIKVGQMCTPRNATRLGGRGQWVGIQRELWLLLLRTLGYLLNMYNVGRPGPRAP